MRTLLFVTVAAPILLVATSALFVNAASAPLGTINWADVPDITAQPEATTNYGSLDIGKCMCDYTPYVCDASCCCDPDCGPVDPSRGRPAFFPTCDRANGGDNQALQCLPETVSGVEVIQARSAELQRREWFGQGSVCVVDTNLAAREGIEPLYTLPSATDAAAALTAPTSAWPAPDMSSSSSGGAAANSFSVGDLIPLVFFDPTSYVASVRPSLKYVPDMGATTALTSNVAGVCDTTNAGDHLARFMQATQGSGAGGSATDTIACDVSGASLAALCAAGGPLNVDQFRYMAVANKVHSLISKDVVVPINLRIVDATSLAVLETFDVSTVVLKSFDSSAAAPAAAAIATAMSGTNCLNAVVGVRLTVEFEPATDGSQATPITAATLVVQVNQNLAPSATARYRRTWSVRYVRKGSVAAGLSNDQSSALTERRSGSPGYVAGRPMLAGYVTSNGAEKQAVYAAPGGFSVPISGHCTAGPRFGAVPFGHNVDSASCWMAISLADLQNTFCVAGALPTLLDSVLKPSLCGGAACPTNVTIFDRIGRDAAAQYNVTADWVSVVDAARESLKATENPAYDSKRSTCSGIVTGLHWIFGVSRGGATYNPQDIIVAAKVKPILGSWTWRPSPTTTRVRFQFKVSFVRISPAGTATIQEIKPPPFFPAVGEDVFYPFKRPDG